MAGGAAQVRVDARIRGGVATAAPRGEKDLALEGMPRERALSCAVRLLDLGFFRIGGEEYAENNESYGVATVLREHVSIQDGEVVFDFPAKSGQRRAWRDVRSEDVNAYLQEKAGEDVSAKDFRTWHGTVLAAVELAREEVPASKGAAERAIRAAVKRVAERLGNTPAVCRSSYIDPGVLELIG